MTLVQALERVAQSASRKSMGVLRNGDVVECVSFYQLYQEAGQLAASLREMGARPGERIAIALPNSAAFARAFFGILSVGGAAVPMPPPYRFASLEIHLKRITLALQQSDVRYILTDTMMKGLLGPILSAIGSGLQVCDIEELKNDQVVYAHVDQSDPALVQYTSGTSGSPKGVVLTHANILANVRAISEGIQVSPSDIGCSWLPLFHDMGLIGHFLVPIFNDNDFYLMRPEDFLRSPLSWLQAIGRYDVTISSGPNSAYSHCLRHVSEDDIEGLDLSRWRAALNGAESIDGRVMRDFATKFGPAGFHRNSFLPVYGLAEATLAVAFPPIGRPPKSIWARRESLGEGDDVLTTQECSTARELISVGSPVFGTEFRVVADDGATSQPEGRIGEIQVRGTSVMERYEGLEGDGYNPISQDGWLATGDMGFECDHELFVVGRKKEMMIVFGQNYYASDIEAVAGAVPGVSTHGVLATSMLINEAGERLLLLVEVSDAEPERQVALGASIRLAVSGSLGITPEKIIFVPKGTIDRTSSGKVRREGIEMLIRESLIASKSAEL